MFHFRLLAITLLFPLFISSQITINDGDMPQSGDTIRLSTAFDLSGIDFIASGPSYEWDFTLLEPALQQVDTFVSVQQTPWVYQLVFFLYANLAKKQLEFDQIPGFEVTDVYEYYKNQGSDFRSVGFGLTLNGIPLPNKYNNPDIIYNFPLNYGNEDSSYATYGIDIPGIGYFGGWKKRVNQVDGWGSLTTPFGTFETLRLKSKVIQFDSLYIDSLGFGIPIYREFTEYKWLGENMGLPLLKVTDDGLLPSFIYVDSLRSLATGLAQSTIQASSFDLFPNPTNGIINVNFNSHTGELIDFFVYNTYGKLVYSLPAILGSAIQKGHSIDLDQIGLKPGLYIMVIQQSSQKMIRKIILR